MTDDKEDVTDEIIELTESNIKDMIYEIRGQKAMLDFVLAKINGYEKEINSLIQLTIEDYDKELESIYECAILNERLKKNI